MPAHTLTQGGITRQLIGLTLPLLLGNLIQQFYNTVDMMIVGQVAGQTPFAAIGVAGSLMSLFTCLLIGFNMGCSILFANRFGARDFAGLRRTVDKNRRRQSAAGLCGYAEALFLCAAGKQYVFRNSGR